MKINCHCGAVIFDQTDYLPHKGHLIPDQDWFDTYEAIDTQVIDRLVAGEISKDQAYCLARSEIGRSARFIYECTQCGRLYVDDQSHNLQCYLPEKHDGPRGILRSDRGGSARSIA